ncbi:MAG TPA: methylated-DNA--[protein]-cysteine S-methyltransferase [Spongiibacteraceae bacterium]|jgi:methylated-DNA-[protein]-cysteine S-methyltransferase
MKNSTIYCIAIPSPLGKIFATATADVVTGLYFEGQKYFPATLPPLTESNAILKKLQKEIDDYFAGKRNSFSAELQPHGTPFQQHVWQALQGIPRGKTLTYSEIAAQLGLPTATRAVAGAIGRNPISIVIPCHRVIGKDGSLTGYAGGVERKAALLRLEQDNLLF